MLVSKGCTREQDVRVTMQVSTVPQAEHVPVSAGMPPPKGTTNAMGQSTRPETATEEDVARDELHKVRDLANRTCTGHARMTSQLVVRSARPA